VASQHDAAEFRVQVRDDGAGFDPDAQRDGDTGAAGGFGLVSLRERARLAGGTLQIESAPGAGTRVILRIPVQREP
jgi:signal transduction histidine kinase